MKKKKKLPAWYSNFVVFAAEKLQQFDPDGLKSASEIEAFILSEIEPCLDDFMPQDKSCFSPYPDYDEPHSTHGL